MKKNKEELHCISHSSQIAKRLKRRLVYRRALSLLYIFLSVVYLGWRTTIINSDSIFASSVYLVAEIFGFILGVTAVFSSWKYKHRDIIASPRGLGVDVIIPTYKEPLAVIRQTVIAAKKIEYPHKTWITDDGARDEIKQMAAELGVLYLSRTDKSYAKAGNLNFALQQTKGEFVVVFDADHIAQPHALDVMLGLFATKNVAMVQTPQDYYNVDAFQYMNPKTKAGYWHDQSFFYNIALQNHDGNGAATCVGTGVTYRRSALEAIGGIPIDTITEDIHTSLKLHKAGFESVYVNEPVAYGIAAADLEDYYRTRLRWGHGNLSALAHEKVLTCSGLSLKQRLSYLSFGIIYLEGWQQFMLLMLPILALVFGLAPFEISVFNVLVILLFPILSYVLLQEVGCGFTRFWTNEIFSMARWPVQIQATMAVLGKSLKWNTSLKNIEGRVSLIALLPQLTVMFFSVLAVLYAINKLTQDFMVGPTGLAIDGFFTTGSFQDFDIYGVMEKGYSLELVVIASFWALFNVIRGSYFVCKVFNNAENSHDFYRFPITLPVVNMSEQSKWAYSTLISENWLGISSGNKINVVRVGSKQHLQIILPNTQYLNVVMNVEVSTPDCLAGSLIWESLPERDQLAATLYSVDWQREIQIKNAYFNTLYDSIVSIFKTVDRGIEPFQWRPILINSSPSKGTDLAGMLALSKDSNGFATLLCFESLVIGHCYNSKWLDVEGLTPFEFKPNLLEPLSYSPHCGLDGATAFRYLIELNESHENK